MLVPVIIVKIVITFNEKFLNVNSINSLVKLKLKFDNSNDDEILETINTFLDKII